LPNISSNVCTKFAHVIYERLTFVVATSVVLSRTLNNCKIAFTTTTERNERQSAQHEPRKLQQTRHLSNPARLDARQNAPL
jgi:hypothetical protein